MFNTCCFETQKRGSLDRQTKKRNKFNEIFGLSSKTELKNFYRWNPPNRQKERKVESKMLFGILMKQDLLMLRKVNELRILF